MDAFSSQQRPNQSRIAHEICSGDENDRVPTYHLLLLLLLLYRLVSNVGTKYYIMETCKIEVASVAPTRVDGRENFYISVLNFTGS